MSPPSSAANRSRWLALILLLLALGLALLIGPGLMASERRVTLGPPGAYLPGTVTAFPAEHILLVASEAGEPGWFHAYSDIDPLSGCLVRWSAADGLLMDPCLGSLYGRDGRPYGGPADRPLTPLDLRVEGGHISVTAPDLSTRPPTPRPGLRPTATRAR